MNPIFTPKHPEQSQLFKFMRFAETYQNRVFESYEVLHHWSITSPAAFWQTLALFFKIPFDTPPTEILNSYQHPIEAIWFEGATMNFAKILLQRRDNKAAIISFNELNEQSTLSFNELYEEVIQVAEGLRLQGILPGDRVAAILPNIAESIIIMLATSAIGGIFSSCSPDFGPATLEDRLGQITPKLLVATNGYTYQGKKYEILEKVASVANHIPELQTLVIVSYLKDTQTQTHLLDNTISWNDLHQPVADFIFPSFPFNHPLYILFSSGTTGKPKCIMHGAGGTLIQHLKELGLHTDLTANDNLCFYTTTGWMMWNWMLTALALGTTLTLYEGSPIYPEPLQLFKLIDKVGITVWGTSAKFISTLQKMKAEPIAHLSLTTLHTILTTGSPLLEPHFEYVYQHIKQDVQLSSISGGTDLVACFALGNPLLPVYLGELQCLGLGMDVAIYNEAGEAVVEEPGELVCRTPFPSMPIRFWQDPEKSRYFKAYYHQFPNVWNHRDRAKITKHHGLVIYGRSDATLNSGGVRIGTAEIYRPLQRIAEIEESVAIAQTWNDDSRIILFVKLLPGFTLDKALTKTIKTTLACEASPRHVPAKIIQVPDIPKTLNGKTVELTIRDIVHGKAISNLDALSNPESIEAFKNRPELSCE